MHIQNKIRSIRRCFQCCCTLFLVILPLFLVSYSVCAESELRIVGPFEVFEHEQIEFTITLDGVPVQARVSFGNGSMVQYSNSTTGKVVFTAPSVPFGNQEFMVTARLFDETYETHTVLVKNKTKVFSIEFQPATIVETKEFFVTISQFDEPVVDAEVWFNSEMYLTDSQGRCEIIAPDVLLTTNYGILVRKDGFTTLSTMVTIIESGLGTQFMELITPGIVEPEQLFTVHVDSFSGGVDSASILVFYQDELIESYTTNSAGQATISAPAMDSDNFFVLLITKPGYMTLTNNGSTLVMLSSRIFPFNLNISIFPYDVYETELITITVTDDTGAGVYGASIWSGNQELDMITDREGIVDVIAPSVFFDRELYIYAIFPGFNFAETKISVRNQELTPSTLFVTTVSSSNETDFFLVTITDSTNALIPEVTIFFDGVEYLTDVTGSVFLQAPAVNESMVFEIEASKYGFLPVYASVEILDQQTVPQNQSNKLKVYVVPDILERDLFTVTVKNNQGTLVSGARVRFLDTEYVTDATGRVTLFAPDVSFDSFETILVSKAGYSSASTEVTIKNSDELPYWYIIVGIIVVGSIGGLVYFHYNRLY